MDGEVTRTPPVQHIVDARLIHEPPTQGKKDKRRHSMYWRHQDCSQANNASYKTTLREICQLISRIRKRRSSKFIDFAIECPEYENYVWARHYVGWCDTNNYLDNLWPLSYFNLINQLQTISKYFYLIHILFYI